MRGEKRARGSVLLAVDRLVVVSLDGGSDAGVATEE
jgi:hypothetical protein